MQTSGRVWPSPLILVLLAAARASGPLSAAESPRPASPGTRVTALTRAVRFALPGTTARLTLTPGTSSTISWPSAAEPPRVLVEEGTAHLEVPAGAPALVRLMGVLHGLHVKSGHAVYTRRGLLGEESGLLLDGEAEVPTGAKSVPFSKEQLLRATPSGSVLGGIEPAVHQAALALSRLARTSDASVVDLPEAALPPPGKKPVAFQQGNLAVLALAGGTTAAGLVADRPTLATDQVTCLRQRLMVGTRDEGLAGPGFFLDFVPVRQGRVRNVLVAGSRGFARFFYSPRWLVTLVPGSVLECDGPDPRGADRRPSTLKLLRGAMMVQGRGGTLPEGVTLSDLASETAGGDAGSPSSREVVTAARGPADAGVSAEVLLARARECLRPLLALPLGTSLLVPLPVSAGAGAAPARPRGVSPVTAVTLLTDLPVSPEFITRYVPVHVASTVPVERLAFSMFAVAPAPDLALGALVQQGSPTAGPEPVALVMPRSFEEQVGPEPRPFGAYVSAQKLDLWQVRRQADESMAKVGLQHEPESAGGARVDARVLVLICAAILVLSVPGVRVRLMALLGLIPGLSRLKCRRCGLVLDRYSIGDFTLEEDHAPLTEILKYDVITEVVRQEKARTLILDRTQLKTPVPHGKARFRFSGSWCQRCLGGSILAEMIRDGDTIDETDWEVVSADTHKLMRMIRNPKLVAELTEQDK